MKNLGKVALMLLLPTIMIASVKASLEKNPLSLGDDAVLVLEAVGKKITFPDIKKIGPYEIKDARTISNFIQEQGTMKKGLIRRFIFHPKSPVDIPSFSVIVDGKKEQTSPLKLHLKKGTKESKKAFVFEQIAKKKELYVGEPLVLTYILKQRQDIDLSDASFHAGEFKNFWAKRGVAVPNRHEDGYNIYQINYIVYPQKEGNLTIDSARMDVGIIVDQKRDLFSFQNVKWKSLYSNALEVSVKPLPKGVHLYGDYSFVVVADKNKTKANEPINLTITIRGEGNVDDIEDFDLKVPHASVYADKAKRNSRVIAGKNEVIFKQQFAIVSDRNFTIPSFSFQFFNGKKRELHSRAFPIEVINEHGVKSPGRLEKKEPIAVVPTTTSTPTSLSWIPIMIASFFSFLLGMLTMWGLFWRRKKETKTKDLTIQQRIKQTKSDKALLALVLPYMNRSKKMQALVAKLEENVYHDSRHKVDAKELAKEFESYLVEQEEAEILKG